MVNKCSVVGCKTGYTSTSTSATAITTVFSLPRDPELKKVDSILPRKDYSVTSSTKVCFLHFENKYIKFNDQRPRLIWHTNPVPTIHPPTTKPSLQSTPSAPRRPPTSRGELDDLEKFKELDKISSVNIIKEKLPKSDIFRNFECRRDEKGITIYKITFDDSYILSVNEIIGVITIIESLLGFL